ncbi:uncharacterized protein LOC105840926 [Monomorium pharaonis]|uniref:uncharacterized protein LOC105840926 n=1 Tax=Monomorium pharaonis TaxID=307658 RepID=UPI0017463733|nr:uncharacterized protein LOC105840926 [Monomorium pharaonis]
MATSDSSRTMKTLITRQQSQLQMVARALANFKKIGRNNYTPAKIRSRIAQLKDTWSQCTNVHVAMLQAFTNEEQEAIEYFEHQEFERHEELYQSTLDYMAEALEMMEPPGSLPQLDVLTLRHCTNSISLSHLPPINIPPFSGKVDDWETFRDRFTSLIIENRDLTAFARMHFLESSLSGRALESIKNIPITADNFDIAWRALESRYDNKRRLVEMHVSALHNLPSVSRESAADLIDLRDKANRAIASLRKLNRSADDILNDILVYSVSHKLDYATRKAWKLKTNDDVTIAKFEDLDRFITARASVLEELAPSTKSARSQRFTSATSATASPLSCPLCNESHYINQCSQFKKKSPSQRLEIAQRFKRCVNCLSDKHAVPSCPSRFSCRTCQKRHHSMLHTDSASVSNATSHQSEPARSPDTTDVSEVAALHSASKLSSRPRVLLATAQVKISSISGRSCNVRALLDQGSEITFISENLQQLLKLRRIKLPLSISAIGGVDAGTCKFAAQIQISPVHQPQPVLTTIASILPSLTRYSPSHALSTIDWTHLSDLSLADPCLTNSDPIDVIIGADLYSELILDGVRKGNNGQPVAQNTILGWVISGPTSVSPSPRHNITVQHCSCSISVEQELQKFWELEEVPTQVILSPEERQCEEHFLATHSRNPDGRYIVRLPFKQGPPIEIGKSRATAERLIASLRRRFKSSPELQREYANFLHEYETLGHMRKAKMNEALSQCVYIPHHPVFRDSSVTTKLRVVFNASSLTSNATSLNDFLYSGPKLQTDLAGVILRWRQPRYVYSADISKMYRQILVDPRDIDYQRILWIDNDTELVQEYQLMTVTYGITSAPYLALRVIRQLIKDEGHSFPLAVSVLLNHTYVDHLLFGADNMLLLRNTRDQVCALLRRGKFELRKWSSNSSALLSDIAADDHGLAGSKSLPTDEQLKILGIHWIPALDSFQFHVSLPSRPSTTKRSILSTIAKLFDPLGWSSPVIISAKIFLQHLWHVKVDWDDRLPSELVLQWEAI